MHMTHRPVLLKLLRLVFWMQQDPACIRALWED